MDIVWAKSPVAQSYIPALVIDVNVSTSTCVRVRTLQLNPDTCAIRLPTPPAEVIAKRPRNATLPWLLLAYFDNAQNWDWVATDELAQFGVNEPADEARVRACRAKERLHVETAYTRALAFRCGRTRWCG